MKRRKNQKKKAYMFMRVGLWASKAECAQKMSEVQQFLERNGYEYDVRMGNVVIDMNDEKFNDMTSWKVLLLLSEMKPIAKGAECFVVRTLTDLSKDMGVAKEMVHVIKEMGIDFKTTDGSEIRLEEKEESVFPEFTENAEPPQPIIVQ